MCRLHLLFVIAASAVLASFVWQGRVGFNLWDEGYLWYGAQRVLVGEVPIRDFMAYDPGRYYWSAALMALKGDNGIMSLRGAVAFFQFFGLWAGLLLIARSVESFSKQNVLYFLLSAITLIVWMFPRHKLFDISLSIFLIGILTFLVQKPSARRYFLTGVGLGLVAVFGRNHGMYGVAGSLGVMAWLSIKRTEGPSFFKGFFLWTSGVIVGFAPILFMILVVPGFAIAFWESIRFLFELKATNLPLPIPWPWKVNVLSMPWGEAIRRILVGLFFIGTIVFGFLSSLWVVRQKLKDKPVMPVLVGASALALPYAHYAYSRADVGHLAQGIFPLLVGCLVLLSQKSPQIKWPFALALCTASIWVMYVFHPGWQYHMNKQWVDAEVSTNTLKVDPATASNILLLKNLSERYASKGQSFIVTPFWPGAYPLLERKAPMWEIFPLFPRPEAFEQKEIVRIKSAMPSFAFVFDMPLDGRDELRFRNTHPLIHQYIEDNFERIPDALNPEYQVYKVRDSVQ